MSSAFFGGRGGEREIWFRHSMSIATKKPRQSVYGLSTYIGIGGKSR